MIAISKDEKDIISERFPSLYIVRTMKQKSKRHHYYCEESKPVMRLIKELRGAGGASGRKSGDDGEHRKKTK